MILKNLLIRKPVLLVLLTLPCIATNAFCQESIMFEKLFSFDNYGSGIRDIKQTEDGGFVAVGGVGLSLFDDAYLVFKTDSAGNMQWYNYFGLVHSQLFSVDITETGNYVGIGVSQDNPDWHKSGAIVMYNSHGDTLWSRQYAFHYDIGQLSTVRFYDGLCTDDNCIVAVGGVADSSFANPLVVKTDMNGDTLWTWRLHKVHNTIVLESVAETTDGDYVAVGRATQPILEDTLYTNGMAPQRGFIVKLSRDGDLIYLKEWTEIYNVFKDIYIDKDGNFVIVGTYIIYEPDVSYHVLLVKTDANGNTMYYRQITYGRFDSGMCVTGDIKNNIYLLNMYTTPLAEDWPDDVLLQKYTPDGELIWQHSIGGQNIDNWPYEIVSTTDGGIAFCGLYRSDNNYSWLVKTDSLGNGPYGLGWINAVPENNFNAEVKVYPNPATDRCDLYLENFRDTDYIEIFDLYGKLVLRVRITDNTTTLDISQLASGIYIVTDNNRSFQRKLIKTS